MNGSFAILLLTSFQYAFSLLVLRTLTGSWKIWRQPVTWFYSTWLVGLALLALPIFEYVEEFSIENGIFFLGGLFAFSIGAFFGVFFERPKKHYANKEETASLETKITSNTKDIYILFLLLFGIVGTGLLALNSILSGGLAGSDSLSLDNVAAARANHMSESISHIGALFGPASIAASIGGFGALLYMYSIGARHNIKYRKLLLLLTIAYVTLASITGLFAFGGRMTLVLNFLILGLAYMEGSWVFNANIKKTKLSATKIIYLGILSIVILTVGWFLSTVYLEKRVQKQSPATLLYKTHRARLSEDISSLSKNDLSSQYFLFSLSYVTTPIPTLIFYTDLPNSRVPGPFYGEYNFPSVARWLRRLTFSADPYSWENSRVILFEPLQAINFGSNVWSTLTRDLIADFGKYGAIVFIFMMGFFGQACFERQTRTPSREVGALLVYLRMIFAFSGLISLLFITQFSWQLYLAILTTILFIYRKTPKRKSSTNFNIISAIEKK